MIGTVVETSATLVDPPTPVEAAEPRRARTGPIDPRLLHYARGTRRYLVGTVLLGALTAALVLLQAWLISSTVAAVVVQQQDLADVRSKVFVLLAVIVGRSLLGWVGER